jgi:hypothetical protein
VYALIQTGGKQYKVSEGTILKVEKLMGEAGDRIVLEQVLMINDGNGTTQIGNPLLEKQVIISPGSLFSASDERDLLQAVPGFIFELEQIRTLYFNLIIS